MKFGVSALLLLCSLAFANAVYTVTLRATSRLFSTTSAPRAIDGLAKFYFWTETAPSSSGWYMSLNVAGLDPGQYSAQILTWADLTSADGTGNLPTYDPTYKGFACDDVTWRADGILLSRFASDAVGNFSGNLNIPLHVADQWSSIGRALVIAPADVNCPGGTPTELTTIYAQGVIGIAQGVPSNVWQRNATGLTVAQAVLNPTTVGRSLVGDITGSVKFQIPSGNQVMVYARISGLKPGAVYGFHVHQFGDWSDENATSAGSHFNPGNALHYLPAETNTRHQGDMGNVIANADGQVYLRRTFNLLTLSGNNFNIIGRAVVLHQLIDQGGYASNSTGNSGARIAMGVIGLTSATALPAADVAPVASATVRVRGTTRQPNANGIVRFVHDPSTSTTAVLVTINGLPPSKVVGLSVYEFGDLTYADGSRVSVGDHFNPYGWTHGCPPGGYRHAGDLGNVTVRSNGTANAVFNVDIITLFGDYSIVGRSLVVWDSPGPCYPDMQGDGPMGMVLAQGVIGVEFVTSNTAHTTNVLNSKPGTALYVATLTATASAAGAGAATAYGTVWIREGTDPSKHYVYAKLNNLPVGTVHGFHIHQYGDLTDGFGSTYGHLDFGGAQHALPEENLGLANQHMGDMGNVKVELDGGVYFQGYFPKLAFTGANNIIGRAIILHASPDQGSSQQPTGNAGARILYGVIGVSSATTIPDFQLAPRGYAMSLIRPLAGQNVRGTISFTRGLPTAGNNTVLQYSLTGLTPSSSFGLVIRQHGDVSSADGAAAGGVHNPYSSSSNACPPAIWGAMGRLGNIMSNAQGVASGTLHSSILEMHGNYSIIGRSITVQSVADDCVSANPPGSIIGQAVIGIGRNFFTGYDYAINSKPATPQTVLRATMASTTGSTVTGQVWFRPSQIYANRVEVYARFQNCVIGKLYGFHIHQFGDWSEADGGSAGSHWNPFPGAVHALPDETFVTRLAGEMGNTMCTNNGEIYFNRHFDLMTVGGPDNMIGRGMILHYAVDQGTSQPPLSNFRVALGVIGVTFAPFPSSFDAAPFSSATATMFGTVNNPDARGVVRLVQQPYNATILIKYSFTGLLPSGNTDYPRTHSLHVHEFGDLTDPAGAGAGYHYNPYNWAHNCYPRGRHVGDIGNFVTDANGDVTGFFIVDLMTLFGTGSVLGRGLVVHQLWDDCTASANNETGPLVTDCGHCGSRFMVGVIGLDSESTTATNYLGAAIPQTGAVAVLKGNSGAYTGQVNIFPTSAAATVLRVRGTFQGFPASTIRGLSIRTLGDVSNAAGSLTGTLHKDLGQLDILGAGAGTFDKEFLIANLAFDDLIGRSIVVTTSTATDSPIIAIGTIGLSLSKPSIPQDTISGASPAALPAIAASALLAVVCAFLARF